MSRRKADPISGQTSRAPATTPEQREQQLVSLAYDLAERQLREGTASSQVIAKLLQYGSIRERVELKKIENENKLIDAKIAGLEAQERIEQLYEKAIAAMRTYGGQAPVDLEPEYDEYDD